MLQCVHVLLLCYNVLLFIISRSLFLSYPPSLCASISLCLSLFVPLSLSLILSLSYPLSLCPSVSVCLSLLFSLLISQINAQTELALRYNDIAPLENHHCAVAFEILVKVFGITAPTQNNELYTNADFIFLVTRSLHLNIQYSCITWH